jgi:membrane protease YdiL (CAAX protease family)
VEPRHALTGRLVAWTTLVLVMAALNFASRFVSQPKQRVPEFFQWSFGIGGLVQYAVLLGIVAWIAAGLPRRSTFALRPPASAWLAVRIAAAGVAIVAAIEYVVALFASPGKAQGILPSHWVHGHVGAFVLSVATVAVVAPVVEELMFRGLGFRLLVEHGRWAAIVGIGIAFGLAHGVVTGLPILVAFGSALAYLRDRTQSVYPGMVVHALFNGAAVALAVH